MILNIEKKIYLKYRFKIVKQGFFESIKNLAKEKGRRRWER